MAVWVFGGLNVPLGATAIRWNRRDDPRAGGTHALAIARWAIYAASVVGYEDPDLQRRGGRCRC